MDTTLAITALSVVSTSHGLVSLTNEPPWRWLGVLFLGTAKPRTSQKESHDYSMIISPALDLRPSLLILVSTSSAPFLLITGLLWVPWHAEHGFVKPPCNPHLLPTQTQPTDYFPLLSYDDAHIISIITTFNGNVHLAQLHSLPTFLFSLKWHIFRTLMTFDYD